MLLVVVAGFTECYENCFEFLCPLVYVSFVYAVQFLCNRYLNPLRLFVLILYNTYFISERLP
jgi:hypothetical protein